MENINYRILLLVVIGILLVYELFFSSESNKQTKIENFDPKSKFTNYGVCDKDCTGSCIGYCKNKCINKLCRGKKGKELNNCIKQKCKDKQWGKYCVGDFRKKCKNICDNQCKKIIKKQDKQKNKKNVNIEDTEITQDDEDIQVDKDMQDEQEEQDNQVDQVVEEKPIVSTNNFDELMANESKIANIKISQKWSQFPDDKIDGAEISNDTELYKQLMIVGNKSAGGVRQVGIWDQLNVNGTLKTVGQFCLGDTCIDEDALKNMKKMIL